MIKMIKFHTIYIQSKIDTNKIKNQKNPYLKKKKNIIKIYFIYALEVYCISLSFIFFAFSMNQLISDQIKKKKKSINPN